MSPIPNFDQEDSPVKKIDSNMQKENKIREIQEEEEEEEKSNDVSICVSDNKTIETMEGKCMDEITVTSNKNYVNDDIDKKIIPTGDIKNCIESTTDENDSKDSPKPNESVHRVHSVNTITLGMGELGNSLPRDTSSDALNDARLTSNITQIAQVNPELCGLPLGLFTKVRSS